MQTMTLKAQAVKCVLLVTRQTPHERHLSAMFNSPNILPPTESRRPGFAELLLDSPTSTAALTQKVLSGAFFVSDVMLRSSEFGLSLQIVGSFPHVRPSAQSQVCSVTHLPCQDLHLPRSRGVCVCGGGTIHVSYKAQGALWIYGMRCH